MVAFCAPLLVVVAFCAPLLVVVGGAARADDRPSRVERSAAEIEREARSLADLLERGLDDSARVWGDDGAGRTRSVRALFLINRLTGSARAFRQLASSTRQPYTRAALAPAYDLLYQDTQDVAEVLETEVRRRRGRDRYSLAGGRADDVLACFDRLQREIVRLSYVKQFADEREFRRGRGRGRSLRIASFDCPNRKDYTYRANACIEGDARELDRTLVRLAFVKRMRLDLDPWEREVTVEERVSVQGIGDGEERRCYFARQIGKEIRVQDRDNLYLILDPPRGRPVVQACFDGNVLDEGSLLARYRR
jgi:hypothetical protein